MIRRLQIAGCAAMLALAPAFANAQSNQAAPAPAAEQRDGARDFDWEIGTWRTQLRRLRSPLSGSTEWVEYQGTSIIRGILEGRANIVELSVEGPAGKIEGLSLRLYNPTTRQWSLNFASIRSGELSPPVVGSFRDGRGEFVGRDTWNGQPILVRFIISDISTNSARFEQAFSGDNGATWEVNWIAIDTRVESR